MNNRRTLRAVAVTTAVGVAISLAGCSAPAPSTTGDDSPQTLRLSTSTAPGNFSIGEWTGGDSTLFLSVYDTIINREVEGEITGGLAESWEYSDDFLELTLSIREGLSFSDGEPVNAEAVVASLDASRAGAASSAKLASIEAVSAVDESTVEISLSRPDAALIPLLAGVEGAVGSPAALGEESSQLEPVGSGPYTLDLAATTTGSEYVLQKNEENWNADAYPFETVEMQVIADPTAVQNALLSGQLDAGGVASADLVAIFPENDFFNGLNNPTALAGLWLVDREGAIVPALADERVRRAINLAIDRESIVNNVNPGVTSVSNQVVSPVGAAFDEGLISETEFDLDEANELMADAGYGDGFEVTMPSTVLSTTYESILSQQLGEIGITVNWEVVPFQDFYAKVFQGTYGMFFMFNGFSGSDAQDVSASLSGLFNPFGTTTPELEELVAAANATADADEAGAFLPVNEYLVEEAWFAPISAASGYYVVSNDLEYTVPLVGSQSVRPWSPASSD